MDSLRVLKESLYKEKRLHKLHKILQVQVRRLSNVVGEMAILRLLSCPHFLAHVDCDMVPT